MLFYLAVLGSFTLAMFCILLWALRRGEFRAREEPKTRVLDLERETGVRRDD